MSHFEERTSTGLECSGASGHLCRTVCSWRAEAHGALDHSGVRSGLSSSMATSCSNGSMTWQLTSRGLMVQQTSPMPLGVRRLSQGPVVQQTVWCTRGRCRFLDLSQGPFGGFWAIKTLLTGHCKVEELWYNSYKLEKHFILYYIKASVSTVISCHPFTNNPSHLFQITRCTPVPSCNQTPRLKPHLHL
jgi:hypothetical protein